MKKSSLTRFFDRYPTPEAALRTAIGVLEDNPDYRKLPPLEGAFRVLQEMGVFRRDLAFETVSRGLNRLPLPYRNTLLAVANRQPSPPKPSIGTILANPKLFGLTSEQGLALLEGQPKPLLPPGSPQQQAAQAAQNQRVASTQQSAVTIPFNLMRIEGEAIPRSLEMSQITAAQQGKPRSPLQHAAATLANLFAPENPEAFRQLLASGSSYRNVLLKAGVSPKISALLGLVMDIAIPDPAWFGMWGASKFMPTVLKGFDRYVQLSEKGFTRDQILERLGAYLRGNAKAKGELEQYGKMLSVTDQPPPGVGEEAFQQVKQFAEHPEAAPTYDREAVDALKKQLGDRKPTPQNLRQAQQELDAMAKQRALKMAQQAKPQFSPIPGILNPKPRLLPPGPSARPAPWLTPEVWQQESARWQTEALSKLAPPAREALPFSVARSDLARAAIPGETPAGQLEAMRQYVRNLPPSEGSKPPVLPETPPPAPLPSETMPSPNTPVLPAVPLTGKLKPGPIEEQLSAWEEMLRAQGFDPKRLATALKAIRTHLAAGTPEGQELARLADEHLAQGRLAAYAPQAEAEQARVLAREAPAVTEPPAMPTVPPEGFGVTPTGQVKAVGRMDNTERLLRATLGDLESKLPKNWRVRQHEPAIQKLLKDIEVQKQKITDYVTQKSTPETMTYRRYAESDRPSEGRGGTWYTQGKSELYRTEQLSDYGGTQEWTRQFQFQNPLVVTKEDFAKVGLAKNEYPAWWINLFVEKEMPEEFQRIMKTTKPSSPERFRELDAAYARYLKAHGHDAALFPGSYDESAFVLNPEPTAPTPTPAANVPQAGAEPPLPGIPETTLPDLTHEGGFLQLSPGAQKGVRQALFGGDKTLAEFLAEAEGRKPAEPDPVLQLIRQAPALKLLRFPTWIVQMSKIALDPIHYSRDIIGSSLLYQIYSGKSWPEVVKDVGDLVYGWAKNTPDFQALKNVMESSGNRAIDLTEKAAGAMGPSPFKDSPVAQAIQEAPGRVNRFFQYLMTRHQVEQLAEGATNPQDAQLANRVLNGGVTADRASGTATAIAHQDFTPNGQRMLTQGYEMIGGNPWKNPVFLRVASQLGIAPPFITFNLQMPYHLWRQSVDQFWRGNPMPAYNLWRTYSKIRGLSGDIAYNNQGQENPEAWKVALGAPSPAGAALQPPLPVTASQEQTYFPSAINPFSWVPVKDQGNQLAGQMSIAGVLPKGPGMELPITNVGSSPLAGLPGLLEGGVVSNTLQRIGEGVGKLRARQTQPEDTTSKRLLQIALPFLQQLLPQWPAGMALSYEQSQLQAKPGEPPARTPEDLGLNLFTPVTFTSRPYNQLHLQPERWGEEGTTGIPLLGKGLTGAGLTGKPLTAR